MRGVPDDRVSRADNRRDASRAGHMKRIDQVAELLAEGFALSDIAAELGITRDAVKSAFKKIKARLGGQAV
jgi:DNA-binding NarL/FixJ family response regulator